MFSFQHRRAPVHKSYAGSVLGLIGHLLGTAAIFTAFFSICWGVTLILHFLDEVHRFPDEILSIINVIEIYVIYADVCLCFFVLLGGAVQFCRDMTN
jgi:hypothetical protein